MRGRRITPEVFADVKAMQNNGADRKLVGAVSELGHNVINRMFRCSSYEDYVILTRKYSGKPEYKNIEIPDTVKPSVVQRSQWTTQPVVDPKVEIALDVLYNQVNVVLENQKLIIEQIKLIPKRRKW